MMEPGFEYTADYRRELVRPLFELMAAGESAAVVGPASMGKSRLLKFVLQPDVQRHYLRERADSTLVVLANCHRLAELSEWGLYELILTALTEASGTHPRTQALRAELNALRGEAVTNPNALLARRHVELAMHVLCHEHDLTVCLLLDEFAALYRTLPVLALANLRALRDANRGRLCFVAALRQHPAHLRSIVEAEEFYELMSRSVLGLGPYGTADAERVVRQLEARKGRELPGAARDQLLLLAGGHPGLILALFALVAAGSAPDGPDWVAWALEESTVQEECRKLWIGLSEDEQLALCLLSGGVGPAGEARADLRLKGLIQDTPAGESPFSPLFARYVRDHAAPANSPIRVDEKAHMVWIGDRPVKGLTPREFELLAFLYRHLSQVCTKDQLLEHLYGADYQDPDAGVSDQRLVTLVRRVRHKIEPNRNHPRYLRTVREKGYVLTAEPDVS